MASSNQTLQVLLPKPDPKLEPVSRRLLRELIHPHRDANILSGLHFSPDGKRLRVGDYPAGLVVIWDVLTGRPIRNIETGFGTGITSDYFSVADPGDLLFSTKMKRKAVPVEGEGKRVYQWTLPGEIKVWNMATGELAKTLKHEPQRNYYQLALSPDGKKLATDEEVPGIHPGVPPRRVSLWNLGSKTRVELPESTTFSVLFSPNSQLLVASTFDKSTKGIGLKVFDATTGIAKQTLLSPEKNLAIYPSAFSPDSSILAAISTHYKGEKALDRTDQLRLWDLKNGRLAISLQGGENESFSHPRFSPDGKTLALLSVHYSETKLLLFQVADLKLIHTVFLYKGAKDRQTFIYGHLFSPDGKTIAVSTQEKPKSNGNLEDFGQPRIHLIDAHSGKVREVLICPPSYVTRLCFSPDSLTLASTSIGKVLLWDLSKTIPAP